MKEYQRLQQISREMYPQLFQTEEFDKLSKKYNQVKTYDAIEILEKHQWFVTEVQTKNIRNKNHLKYCKHIVRMRNPKQTVIDNELTPEIVLINSHDGTSSFKMMCGLFRLVCSNGLIIGDSLLPEISIRHDSKNTLKVEEFIDSNRKNFEIISDKKRELENRSMNDKEKMFFYNKAFEIMWPKTNIEFDPKKLGTPKRIEDKSDNLWNVYNTVQENLIKGGIKYHTTKGNKTRSMTTREIKSPDRLVQVNKNLWDLAMEME
ncbi:MAG: DUF932 domain-containing protein, partial [bacterium]